MSEEVATFTSSSGHAYDRARTMLKIQIIQTTTTMSILRVETTLGISFRKLLEQMVATLVGASSVDPAVLVPTTKTTQHLRPERGSLLYQSISIALWGPDEPPSILFASIVNVS